MASFTQLNQLYTGKQSYHGQFEAETIEICIGNHTVFLVQFGINLHE